MRLFPGWGGQAYDAEALYVHLDTSYLYLALVTGLSPNTPNNPAGNSYGPGDFAIDFLDFGQAGSFAAVSRRQAPMPAKSTKSLPGTWACGMPTATTTRPVRSPASNIDP